MSKKSRFTAELLIAFIPTIATALFVIFVFYGRVDEILSMEDHGAGLFAESCAITTSSIFLLLLGTSMSAIMVDRIKARAFASKGMDFERDTTRYSLYLAVAGIFVPISILYAQYINPNLIGDSKMAVALPAIMIIVIEYVLMRVVIYVTERMEERACQTA